MSGDLGQGASIDDDAIILLRAATGQSRAVEAVIDRFGPLVWALARRLLANPQDAEDAVQEVFIELWRAAPRFDPSIASARSFVSLIARRRIIDRGRAEQSRARAIRQGAPLGEHPQPGEAAPWPIEADAERLARAVAQLRPEQQQTLRLSIGHGWSHQEISDRLGLPLGTVKTNLRRGLQRLQQIIVEGVADAATPAQEAPR